MNADQKMRQQVCELFATETERVWRQPEIGRALSLRGKASQQLGPLLRQMTLDGEIVELRPGVFGLGRAADLVTGRLEGTRSGNARLNATDAHETIWVRPEDQSTALPGDTVLVRLNPQRSERGSREGRVIRMINRSAREIVGTLHSTGRFFYVVPIDPVYKQDFYVPEFAAAKVGDRVAIRFIDWPNRHVNPEGEIVEVLGPSADPSLDTETIIRQFDLPRTFPEAVIREAERAVERVAQPGRREDCRKLLIVTIDPERARDFDDALSLTRNAQGEWELGVHIADVSHFVRPGSALDTEARERGTSVYLPDLVLPMLPEQLANGVCSLRPDEDRLAFSVFMTLDPAGVVRARRFARTRIRSSLRLTYEQAMALIEDRAAAEPARSKEPHPSKPPPLPESLPEGVVPLLKTLHQLTKKIRTRRFQAHALDLDVPECEVLIGPDGRMTGVRAVVNDESHQLIEECMVLANEAVAAELQGHHIRIMSRLHEPPDVEKIEELQAELIALGFQPGDLSQPRNLSAFLTGIQDHPLHQHAHILVLRSMKRAVYSTDGHGHYGLGKAHYAHFTSPIRRYPDLTLHRQLADFLTGRKSRHTDRQRLSVDALHCSDREQRAEEASRAIIEIKKFRYLQQQLDDQKPETYDAVVAKVTNFGCFVDIPDLQMSGLVHVTAMSEGFVRHDRADDSLHADGQVYRVAMPLRVRVVKVDFNQRRADFSLVRDTVSPSDTSRKTRKTRSGKERKPSRAARGRPPRKGDVSPGPRSAKVHR